MLARWLPERKTGISRSRPGGLVAQRSVGAVVLAGACLVEHAERKLDQEQRATMAAVPGQRIRDTAIPSSAASARHATGMSRSGTRVWCRPGRTRQTAWYPGRFEPRAKRSGNECSEPEDGGEPVPAALQDEGQPDGGQHDDRPAEVDDLLELVRVPREERRSAGRVVLDLAELAAARARRVPDGQHVGDEPGQDRRRSEQGRPPESDERVAAEERDHGEREVELPRERDRAERRAGEDEPPVRPTPRAFDRKQREREEQRRPGEEVSRAPLCLQIRSQPEREPRSEGRPASQAELTEPEGGEPTCTEEADQHEGVPGENRPEQAFERPVDVAEGPAG